MPRVALYLETEWQCISVAQHQLSLKIGQET